MRVLLLGSNGLLGHNVLKLLLQQGHEVHALLRSLPQLEILNSQLSIFRGSLLDDDMLKTAAQGCDAIINCAGVTDMSLLHYEDYLPVNRDLCRRLILLMEQLHIATLVHTSTANTIGYGTPARPADEQAPMQSPFRESFYARSKKEGEDLLLKAAVAHPEWHIVVLNPGFMIGAYDTKPSSGRLLLAGYRKLLMVAPSGGKSFIHVSDVASAAVNALIRGDSGRRYLLTGRSMSLKQFYQLQSEVCGYRQKVVSLPNWLLALAGRCGDLMRLCGLRTQLSTRNVRQLMVEEFYDNSSARRDLLMPQTHIEQAIADFFAWNKDRDHT